MARRTGVPIPPSAGWQHQRQRRFLIAISIGAALLLAVGFTSLMLGAIIVGPVDAARGLASESDLFTRLVVWEIRLPRFLDAMLVGAALGTAGALLQVVTRNPLADPTILGISSAAGLAIAIMLVTTGNPSDTTLALAGVGGGLIGAGGILVIAWGGAVSALRLTLAGVALAAFFGAAIVGLLASSRTFLEINLGFLAGGLYGSEWREVKAIAPWVIPGLVGAQLLAGRLNALALGDEIAASLGVLTDRTRLFVLALAGALTGVAVSVAGLVSFVGLVSPHLARFRGGIRPALPAAGVDADRGAAGRQRGPRRAAGDPALRAADGDPHRGDRCAVPAVSAALPGDLMNCPPRRRRRRARC